MSISTGAELISAVQNYREDTDTATARVLEWISLCEGRIAADLRIRSMEAVFDLFAFQTYPATAVGGTANVITVTTATGATALTRGQTVSFEAAATNTGSVTLAVNGTAATAYNIDDGSIAMGAGEIFVGETQYAYFDGTRWRKILPGQVPLPTRYLQWRRLFLAADPKGKLDFKSQADFYASSQASVIGKPSIFTVENEYITFAKIPDADYVVKALYWRRFAALANDSGTNNLLVNFPNVYLYGSLLEGALYDSDDESADKWGKLYQDIIERVRLADVKDRHSSGPLSTRSEYRGS